MNECGIDSSYFELHGIPRFLLERIAKGVKVLYCPKCGKYSEYFITDMQNEIIGCEYCSNKVYVEDYRPKEEEIYRAEVKDEV